MCVYSRTLPQRPDIFEGARYVCHGHGFEKFWRQERTDCTSTQCSDIFQELERCRQRFLRKEYLFLQFVAVYAQPDDKNVERYKLDLLQTMGGKGHVRCKCNNFPFIPTPAGKGQKKKCNISHYFREDSSNLQHTTCTGCQEAYVCTNPSCRAKICRKCYNTFPEVLNGQPVVTTVVPPNNICEEDDETNDAIVEDHSDNESVGESAEIPEDNDNISTDGSVDSDRDSNADYENYSDFLVNADQDLTLDTTQDNTDIDIGFETTDAGDEPVNIHLRDGSDPISGAVLFNQVGSCTTRQNNIIRGTNRQRNFVQKLCSTSPGQVSPLLQPEAAVFPRHFYVSAEHNAYTLLGARPLVLYSTRAHPYGYKSGLITSRIRMTSTHSTTGTDLTYMAHNFDELGNRLMSSSHSRDIYSRGFVVEQNSTLGVGVRERGHTTLSQAVDSNKMVLRVGALQKWIDWNGFFTLTLNQKFFPGVAHLHEWKESMLWTRSIPNWINLSSNCQDDYKTAFENSYGVQAFSNWNTVQKIFLGHIKEHLTQLGGGACLDALFGRHEFQDDRGNFDHIHLLYRVKPGMMNPNIESYLDSLISTSVIELVRTDDIESMVEEGLLENVEDVYSNQDLANIILRHICGRSCLKRIGPGESPRNFRCRKIHSVKSNPNPTKYFTKQLSTNSIPYCWKF